MLELQGSWFSPENTRSPHTPVLDSYAFYWPLKSLIVPVQWFYLRLAASLAVSIARLAKEIKYHRISIDKTVFFLLKVWMKL